ncbi:MAG: hypothetical protein Q9218_003633 [Villophora microphyllina]
MRNILEFPNETLDHIVRFLPYKDFIALNLSSKVVYNLVGPALRRHLRLENRYGVCSFGYFEEHNAPIAANVSVEDNRHPLLLLGTVLDNPDVANYPTKLKSGGIGWNEIDLDEFDGEDVVVKKQAVSTKHSERLRKIVEDSRLIQSPERNQLSEALSDPRCENASFCLLITLLPNLDSLDLHNWALSGDMLKRIVQNIAFINRDSRCPSHKVALPQLREVFLADRDTGYGEDIEFYLPFAMLPSMRDLTGYEIGGEEFAWHPQFPPQSSTVTSIEFINSAVTTKAFKGLLSGIAALNKFTYAYGDAIVGRAAYKPIAIIEALRKYASHSLKLLDVEGQAFTLGDEEEDEPRLGSLRVFERLKTIRLEDTIFFHDDEAEEIESVETLPDGKFHVADDGDGGPSADPLIEILPASVKTFTLVPAHNQADQKTRVALLADLVERKVQQLPNLNTIAFECLDPLVNEQGLKDAIKASGIRLWSRTKQRFPPLQEL